LAYSLKNQVLSKEALKALTQIIQKTEEKDSISNIKFYPIGRIEVEEGNFQLVLSSKYKDSLKGLEGFSHIQGIWWFDGCDNEIDNNQLITQKPYTEGPERLGTFATRSPARPNPIAITTWEIASIDYAKGIVKVYYIDALNGTPLLDIKPYTPSLDKVGNPTVPDWCKHWPKDLEGNRDFDWEKEFNFERND
jgi:tRNA-Thr(GGU) m(6)t(6)A37 methyltransferase TsaA